ncbi:MAG TPA: 6-bladed beta-propeller, partial [Coriobacteriia bacterium]|nr:6-bladed beta-propeller [Coriobacteriia bacterium]
MASTGSLAARRTVIATVAMLVILLLLLGGLLALNFILRQPPVFDGRDAAVDGNWLFSIYGFEGNLLRRPANATFDSQGNIHVADTGKNRIVVFDSDGAFIATYGSPGNGPTDLTGPVDVAVAADGRSYVIDRPGRKMVIFDPSRVPVEAISFPDDAPMSVTIRGEELVVTTASGILIGNLDGELLMGYVDPGREPGQFDRPNGIAIGPDGTLFVADTLNYRVQAIGTDGEVRWTYGEPLPAGHAIRYDGPGRMFGLPASIAADEAGYLYVVDGLNGEIQILEQETGEHVETIGDIGHEDGLFYYPDGIDYRDGRIVVADKFNDRVQVFRVPAAAGVLDRALPLAPWLLAPLALLALIPVLRRGRANIMTPSFADRLATDARGQQVAEALKKVVATPSLMALHQDDYKDLKWRSREFKDDRVAVLMDEHELSRENAEALDVALHARGKKVLLSDDPALASVATEYEITVVTYDEILETLGVQDAPEV